jgi:hypothetical protein
MYFETNSVWIEENGEFFDKDEMEVLLRPYPADEGMDRSHTSISDEEFEKLAALWDGINAAYLQLYKLKSALCALGDARGLSFPNPHKQAQRQS